MCDSDVSFICVGTPVDQTGQLDLSQVMAVVKEIGLHLRALDRFHVVVLRSTILPGSTERAIIPALEAESHKRALHEFGVVVNPEVLREGSAIADYRDPARIVVGHMDERSGQSYTSYMHMLRFLSSARPGVRRRPSSSPTTLSMRLKLPLPMRSEPSVPRRVLMVGNSLISLPSITN